MSKIAIIGGGASGLLSACKINCAIVILESNDRVGKKILQTGNGRCNLTNTIINPTDYFSDDSDAVAKILGNAPYDDIKTLFDDLGLLTRCEDGKIYPLSNQASSVLDLLRYSADDNGVITKCNFSVESIKKTKSGFVIKSANGDSETADKVILACGGMASSKISGYNLAKSLGHTIITPSPALVPVKLKSDIPKSLKGIRAKAKVTLANKSKVIASESGEIQFTDYGISGIAIMQLSRYYSKGCTITIDFAENYSESEILALLQKSVKKNRLLEDLLLGITVKRIGMKITKSVVNYSMTEPCSILNQEELLQIAKKIKAYEFETEALMGFDSAQVTRGGIPLAEINPYTMESKSCKDLYILGEMLNCDGRCGGYNLSWAWLTAIRVADAINKG